MVSNFKTATTTWCWMLLLSRVTAAAFGEEYLPEERMDIWDTEELDARVQADQIDSNRPQLKHVNFYRLNTADEVTALMTHLPNTLESLGLGYDGNGTPEQERVLFGHPVLRHLKTSINIWSTSERTSGLSADGLRALWGNMRGLMELRTDYSAWKYCPANLGEPVFANSLEKVTMRGIGNEANNLDCHLARLSSVRNLELFFRRRERVEVNSFFERIFGTSEQPTPLAKSVKELKIWMGHHTQLAAESLDACSSLGRPHIILRGGNGAEDVGGSAASTATAAELRKLSEKFGPLRLTLLNLGEEYLAVLLDELAALGRVEEMVMDLDIAASGPLPGTEDEALKKILKRYRCLGDRLLVDGQKYEGD